MISGGTAGGSSMNFTEMFSSIGFETLFTINNTLFLVNYYYGVASLLDSYQTFVEGEMGMDGKKLAEGFYGLIGGAIAVGSAMKLRYDNYDYIFEYADKGDECLDKYIKFTMRNMLNTIVNIANYYAQKSEDPTVKLVASSLYAQYYSAWLIYDEITDPDSDHSLDQFANMWNGLGILLALV